jgi:hypothetical protein
LSKRKETFSKVSALNIELIEMDRVIIYPPKSTKHAAIGSYKLEDECLSARLHNTLSNKKWVLNEYELNKYMLKVIPFLF